MNPPRLVICCILVVSTILWSCGNEGAADEPPTIAYGRDTCDRCGMIISDERFAAGLVSPDGGQSVYDDAGEMIADIQEQGLGSRRPWVHDYDSATWIDAAQAFFAVGSNVDTPMATGVIAFKEFEAATAFTGAHGGTVKTWEEILAD